MENFYHFSKIAMEDLLFELDAKQLRKIHKIYKDFAERALARARRLEAMETQRAEVQRKSSERAQIPYKIMRALENGASLNVALRQIEAEYNALDGFALMHWKQFIKSTEQAAISNRAQLIIRLARTYSNKEIGLKLGMNAGSISRILSRQTKERARAYKALTLSLPSTEKTSNLPRQSSRP